MKLHVAAEYTSPPPPITFGIIIKNSKGVLEFAQSGASLYFPYKGS